MGMTAAATDPRCRRWNTSAERAQGTTVQRGSMRSAASWLKEPSSPWMASFITGKVAGEGRGSQMFSLRGDDDYTEFPVIPSRSFHRCVGQYYRGIPTRIAPVWLQQVRRMVRPTIVSRGGQAER